MLPLYLLQVSSQVTPRLLCLCERGSSGKLDFEKKLRLWVRHVCFMLSHICDATLVLLALCSLSSFHRPKRQQDQPHQALPVQRRADPAENWSWDRTPPPSRPENGHLSKALLIKTASKPPTPWRWCVYWNTISQKCHCFQVLKNLPTKPLKTHLTT